MQKNKLSFKEKHKDRSGSAADSKRYRNKKTHQLALMGADMEKKTLVYNDLLTGKPVIFKPRIYNKKIEIFFLTSKYRNAIEQEIKDFKICQYCKNHADLYCSKIGRSHGAAARIIFKNTCNFFKG